jgi:hypothetical protein
MLSDKQEEQIEILKDRIEKFEIAVQNFEERMDDENEEWIQEKIDELNEKIQEYNDEITDMEDSPEGEFPDDLIEDKVQEFVNDVRRDPEWFLSEFGLNWNDFINKEDFIQGVIGADGYGHTINSYDGNADEIYVKDQLFYVMRID